MHNGVVFNFGEFKSRKCFIISISRDYARKGQKNKKALKNQGFSWLHLFYSPYLVAEMGFFIAPSAFVSSPIACDTRLCRLATRDIASAKSVINRFVPCSPIPFSEGHEEDENPDSARAEEKKKHTTRVCFPFLWLRRWDLNLMTFGL